MRIVGGRWAGRTLTSPSGRVRPTAEAVRRALVPLARKGLEAAGFPGGIEGARVADLFAGTGAVGIELLSHGASTCDFVEDSPSALHALKANVAGLRLPRGRTRIFRRDAIPMVEATPTHHWDLVFMDPPWGSAKLARVVGGWLRSPWSRVLLVEHAADQPFPRLPRAWKGTRLPPVQVEDALLTCLVAPAEGQEAPDPEDADRDDRGQDGAVPRRSGRPGPAGAPGGRRKGRTRGALLLGAALLPAGWLGGCDRAPRLDAPVPDAVEEEADALALLPSLLAAPVVYDLTPAVRALEENVPLRFGGLDDRIDHPENDRVQVAFEVEREPFQWSLVGDTARLTTVLHYRGRGWYDPPLAPEVSASCGTGDGERRPRAVLTLSSPLTVDEGWRLRSRARIEEIRKAGDDPEDQCTVTVFGIDVTERVLAAARGYLEENSHRIDEAVAGVRLSDHLEGVWTRLLEPHELTDDVWLQVRPTGVSLGQVRGEGDRVHLDLTLEALPRLVLGPRPGWEPEPLPPLGAGGEGEGLRILLDARGRWEEAGERLTREFGGEVFEWGGREFRIREVTVRGLGGGRLAMGVRFDGSARGRIFLVGTPALELDSGEIHVPDLEFDVETLDLLVRSAAWITRGNLVEVLRERARLPVSTVLDFAREKLAEGLNRELSDQVRLEGEVLSAELLEVLATVDELRVRARAEARATVVVTPPDEEPYEG